jgi:phosphatidylethanolamine-binding protein (PEBP) family uncharacterized protein
MLQHVPHKIGRMLKNVRPGFEQIFYFDPYFKGIPDTIHLTSPAFADGEYIPVEFTADGKKISPPLQWEGIPNYTKDIILIVEDADSPTPHPLTHAIASFHGLVQRIQAGSIMHYLPPDPPPGHGAHRYVFQLFALDKSFHALPRMSKRSIKEAIHNHVLAKGIMVGIYERD